MNISAVHKEVEQWLETNPKEQRLNNWGIGARRNQDPVKLEMRLEDLFLSTPLPHEWRTEMLASTKSLHKSIQETQRSKYQWDARRKGDPLNDDWHLERTVPRYQPEAAIFVSLEETPTANLRLGIWAKIWGFFTK